MARRGSSSGGGTHGAQQSGCLPLPTGRATSHCATVMDDGSEADNFEVELDAIGLSDNNLRQLQRREVWVKPQGSRLKPQAPSFKPQARSQSTKPEARAVGWQRSLMPYCGRVRLSDVRESVAHGVSGEVMTSLSMLSIILAPPSLLGSGSSWSTEMTLF